MAVKCNDTVVIKLGSSVLTAGSQQLNRPLMLELVRQCVAIQQLKHQVIIVTSGAIAAGRAHLGNPALPNTITSKQLLAAVGQTRLIQLWEQLFSLYDRSIGQMLLTRADLEGRERFLNARDTLLSLLQQGIIPVINENDAVVTTEIKFGDNDNLSALVAILASADKLLLLIDQAGLFDADLQTQPNAQLIAEVHQWDSQLWALAGESGSALGTGGMRTKRQAAQMACRAGIEVTIAAGQRTEVIIDGVAGCAVGTRFHPHPIPLERRKGWPWGAPIAGELQIDQGAAAALCHQGSSLLPKGIQVIHGQFTRGEVVRLVTGQGLEIARGVSRYASEALQGIQGQHSAEIQRRLGYTYGPVVIHRDDMIFCEPRILC